MSDSSKPEKPRKTSIGSRYSREEERAPRTPPSAIQPVTDANFDATVLGSELPVLVDFWATWCGPCKAVAPILEEISKEYEGRLKIVKYNTEQNSRVAGAMAIRSIPTLVLFKDGKVADVRTGAGSKPMLTGWIDRTINPKPGLISRLFGRS